MRDTCVPVHQIYRQTSPQGKTKTGAETLHTNHTKWPRELRHPDRIIRNGRRSKEIQHKITQEDVGRTGRAHELIHSTRIDRTQHATVQNGYYYSVASTTCCCYYGWLLLQVPSVSYFTWGPQLKGNLLLHFTWGPNSGPREIRYRMADRLRAPREIRYRMATTTGSYYYYPATTTTAPNIEDGSKAITGAETSRRNLTKWARGPGHPQQIYRHTSRRGKR